jgi:archaellum biogenesis ATPase FlaH
MRIETMTEFLSHEDLPTEEICGPILRTGELCLLYARAGAGKSMLTTCIAHAAATGGQFLKWKASRPFRVVYIEAEMSAKVSRKRMRFVEMAADRSVEPRNLRIITRDEKNHLPNLATRDGQVEIYRAVKDYDLIVIDNLTTMAVPESNRDDDVQMWHRIKPFLIALRNQNKTVLLVHHSGKSGSQLGTSLRENDQDVIIRLTSPKKPIHQHKLSIQIEFDKTRDLEPMQKEGVYAEFFLENGRPVWDWQPLKEARHELIRRMALLTKNPMSISTALHCDVWDVYEALAENKEPKEDDKTKTIEPINEEMWGAESGDDEFDLF